MSFAHTSRIVLRLVLAITAGLLLTVITSPAARAASPSPWLHAGECLQAGPDPYGYTAPGAFLRSQNGMFTLSLTGGRVELLEWHYGVADGDNWDRFKSGAAISRSDRSLLCMQPDGNLTLYTSTWHPLWASNTIGSGTHNFLWMLDDGNLAMFTSSGRLVWTSQTTRTVYVAGETMASGTTIVNRLNSFYNENVPVGQLSMQADGNLVLRRGGTVTWTSNTHVPGSRLVVQGDGNVGIWTPDNRAVWASWTQGSNATFALNQCLIQIHTSTQNATFGWPYCI